jgi:hypothetical protein
MDGGQDVGSNLVARLEATVNERVHKAIALRIRTKVLDARNDPDPASRRWPFELIQNAHDAGARAGRTQINLSFGLVEGVLHFEHDASPFTIDEFAALLTGGSSKDFMSTETTGRFGTGFLVTHVLSERVHVSGILEVDEAHRAFSVDLYRPNDEKLLLENVQESQDCLLHTRLVEDLTTEPTASFDYIVDDEKIALAGLDAIEQSLPHLFATCRLLGKITIQRGGHASVWTAVAAPRNAQNWDGIRITELNVSRVDNGSVHTDWRVIRAAVGTTDLGRLVVALRKEGDTWAVCKPGALPSVYRQLPLLGGPTLPGWVVVDGQFEVEQERRSIHVTGEAEYPLRDAFAALGGLMLLAKRENWHDGFRIAQLAVPIEVTGDTATKVWRKTLATAAATLSRLPIVHSARNEALPCAQDTEHEVHADIIQRPLSGPAHDELWQLAAASTGSDPPDKGISEGWSEVAEGWEKFGVKISWIDLKCIGERVSGNVKEISKLEVDGDPYDWLARYLDAVGKSWQATGTTKAHVANLLPDQHGMLREADKLRRDGGVTERVKQISADIDLDIRAQLLDLKLVQRLTEQSLVSGLYAIHESTVEELSEAEAIAQLVQRLASALPDDQKLTEKNEKAASATLALLAHLWSTQKKAAEHAAFGIPLLAADGTSRLPGKRRVMVQPVAAWPESARPFAEAYPPSRVLSDRYAAPDQPLLEALVAWGIAHPALLTTATRDEVPERGLRPIASDPEQVSGAVLRDASMSQIALLEPELLNYCKQSRERARKLLGLIVCFVAATDASWRSTAEMTVRIAGGEKNVSLTPTLWLSDVRSKPWIPVEEEGADVDHPATPTLVRHLLDPSWLEKNRDGADLLVSHFGIDALEVRLLAAASTDEERQKLRNSLARIVEAVEGNAKAIEEIVVQAQQWKRDVTRMRLLGLAVQDCVKAALKRSGLSVEEIDHGYDFRVTPVQVTGEGSEELSSHFEIAGYKVEVKTTTTGEARLTPLQAETSVGEPDAFVLCVVDLRRYPGDVHRVDWTHEDVSSLCKLVPGRHLPISKTISLVQNAEESDVPLRNAAALRYAVRPELWEGGLDFDAWVKGAFEIDKSTGTKA